MARPDRRSARRIEVRIPVALEVLGAPRVDAPSVGVDDPTVERITYDTSLAGQAGNGLILDLSENGAFIGAEIRPPVLSRVAIRFNLGEYEGSAIGLVTWRRREAGQVKRPDGPGKELRAGFGVLFEAVRFGTRVAIADFLRRRE